MKTGIFLFGGVEMDDAGSGLPAPTDRRYGPKEIWHATERIVDMGVLSDKLGFDSYWLTEHHFQYEGYEVVPNGMMLGAILFTVIGIIFESRLPSMKKQIYDDRITEGHIGVVVTCDESKVNDVEQALTQAGAVDVKKESV